MKNFSFYNFLYSKDGIVLTMLLLMALYVPNAAFLMKHLGHLDWVFVYYCGYAFAFELGILMIMVNGNARTGELTGKIYSVASGIFIFIYYVFMDDQGNFIEWHQIQTEKLLPGFLLSGFHSMLIWNLVDILKAKLEEVRKVDKVDPKLTYAQEVLKESSRHISSLEQELREVKRELILKKIKHAKGEKSKAELTAELEAL